MPMTRDEALTRLKERLAITGTDTSGKPHCYTHGTRQILEQLDLFPANTPCRIVSVGELEAILCL